MRLQEFLFLSQPTTGGTDGKKVIPIIQKVTGTKKYGQ